MKDKVALVIMVTAILAIGLLPMNMTLPVTNESKVITEAPVGHSKISGFDSDNITITLLEPANQSIVAGTFNMTLDISSVNGPLNLTLFIDGEIYPDYNHTEIGTGTQNVTVDTTTLSEGLLNFTLLFVDNSTGTNDKESYYLVFEVNNYGAPVVDILAPTSLSNFTGLDDLYINITSGYSQVYLNITVDGEITSEFNNTLVDTGASNFTINGTRYENGLHEIEARVVTEEGLTDTDSVELVFLDHVRFAVSGYSGFDRISETVDFTVRVFTPYEDVLFSIYVDNEISAVVNQSIPVGRSTISFNTTTYSEGEHDFLFIAYDDFGHSWKYSMVLVVDNHGVPELSFISPDEDVVSGYAEFKVEITTTWETVSVTIYVDDVEIAEYTNYTASAGEFVFYINTAEYTKWEHEVTIEVITDEGETAEISQTFGFANMQLEEIISIAILLGLAFAIPLYRKKQGHSIMGVLIADLIFLLVLAGIFLIMGITSIPLALWHFNLASIWILGGLLGFSNWVLPILYTGEE
ncbi:hypothetical protein EU537_08495 [Candidatus Thorarchaeota archaeon]|nr:MAG: hypothetical protein EU537_08495 [Candidatus Thorarchaeota archaeon]